MKAPPSAQKLRGGYYTPEPIARFLSGWTIRSRNASVLEPGCGDGQFLEQAVGRLRELGARRDRLSRHLSGVEIDRVEAGKAVASLSVLGIPESSRAIRVGDFFEFAAGCVESGRRFDAILGNPPFIRYQTFPEAQREPAFAIMESVGLHPSRLTNAWVPFVVASTLLLSTPGRIGLVMPAELLQVGYTAELRRFLIENYGRITLVTFRGLLFGEDVQQEVLLFLGERNGRRHSGIRTVEMDGPAELGQYKQGAIDASALKPVDHSTDKWTKYFLETDEILLLRDMERHRRLTRLGEYASVDVGIVTGANDFFVLTEARVGELGLSEYARPLVSKSPHLGGLVFTEGDWLGNAESGRPAYLLDLPDVAKDDLSLAARRYIAAGEASGAHSSFKCRIRDPWWVLPSNWVPAAFMLRQIGDYPRIVENQAGATSTDTIHRVKMLGRASASDVCTASLNSLTLAHSEVVGRSYGGGVLELEPREAERLLIPPPLPGQLSIAKVDSLVRSGDVEAALDLTDETLLRGGIGLSLAQVERFRGIWTRLRDRRSRRRQSNRGLYRAPLSVRFPDRGFGYGTVATDAPHTGRAHLLGTDWGDLGAEGRQSP